MSRSGRTFDAVVVGSGAAGSIAVKELTERGLDVLLLEAGRDLTDADVEPLPPPRKARPPGLSMGPRARAALRGQHVQARRMFFRESSSRFLVNDRENPYTSPRGEPYVWIRGRILGGRLHSYGRVLLRMSDHDFGAAGRDGQGEDWPFSYRDLAPYYDGVEEHIGVYGNADGVEAIPNGRYVGPAKLSGAEREFKAKVEAQWPERRVIAWRYQAPDLGRVPRGIAAARRTGRLTTRTDAVVRRITVDERTGRVDGAVFVDRRTKTEHRARADIVVLCASTIESIRLMLNSACASHPDGLGNSSGLLGRYFMDQTISMAFGGVPQRIGSSDPAPRDPFHGAVGGVFIPRFQNLGSRSDSRFMRGFAFQGSGGRLPVPPGHPTPFAIGGIGEMLPSPHNRVTLNRGRTDAWGIPVAHIRCAIGDNDRAIIREQTRVLEEMCEAAGLRLNFVASMLGIATKQVFPDAGRLTRFAFRRGYRLSLAMGGAIHECGGARMGSDPATSVLDEHNRCWDVPNLFVTDGSCFPSGGTVGPTLTIMAVTARACDHIAREHAGPGGVTRAAAARGGPAAAGLRHSSP